MDRWEKRKAKRMLQAVERKAKEDMYNWMIDELDHEPSIEEVKAWKSGYIAATNRFSSNG